jgi:hypothetical protein
MIKATRPTGPAVKIQFALTGNVSAVPLHEVVGMLVAGRKHGLLKVTPATGASLSGASEGLIVLHGGGIASVEFGSLGASEALMELLSLPDASFSFMSTAKVDRPAAVDWTSVLMERARLEDEMERHAAYYPGDKTRLLRSDKNTENPDELNCGAPLVLVAIEKKPRITPAELFTSLPLCTLKIRLAISWLTARSALGEYHTQGIPVAMRGLGDAWHQKLIFAGRGGVRILLASPPDDGPEDLSRQIALIADDVQSERPEVSMPQDGPVVVRLRPKTGGLISITILPVSKRHRAMFESLLPGAQIAVLPSLEAAGESQVWRYLIKEKVAALAWGPERHNDGALLGALKDHAAQVSV